MVSPFNLSRALPVGGGLFVPRSLPGPPVVKHLVQMVTVVPGQGGRFSQRASPNRSNSAATGRSCVPRLSLCLAAFQSLLSGAGSPILGCGGN